MQRASVAGAESDLGPPGKPHCLLPWPPSDATSFSQDPQATRPAPEKIFFASFYVRSANSDKECVGLTAQGHLLGISRQIFRHGEV